MRGRQQGTLYEDKARGRWVAGVMLDDGSRPRRFFASKREAQAWLNTTLGDLQHGKAPIKGHGMSVAVFLGQWLAWRQPEVRASTYRQYESICRVHLTPALGARPLAKLTATDVKAMLAVLAGRPNLAPNTVRLVSRVLRMALTTAKDLGLVADNVALQAPPTRDQRQVRNTEPLSSAELDRLLDASRGRAMEHLFALAAATGLRKGELLGLRWADVDFDAGRLHVRQALVWLPGQAWRFDAPKTQQGRRQFPLIGPARAALQAQKARVAKLKMAAPIGAWADLDLVFPNEIGGPVHPSNVNREWGKVLTLAGLDQTQTFHNLRHGAATYLLEAGVDPRVVMDLMGWSQTSMLARYQAVRSAMVDDAGAKLAAVFPTRAAG